MAMTDALVSGLAQYGYSLVFIVVFLASLGLPLPATLILLSAGALTARDHLSLGVLITGATGAAVLGDQLGYTLGRGGGRRLIAWMQQHSPTAERLARAERLTQRWGGLGVFMSRWLVTPLGPLVNLASGLLRYAWPSFLALDLLGELLWVSLYVGLGRIVGDQVATLDARIAPITWMGVGVIGLITVAWRRSQHLRNARRLMVRRA